VKILPRLVSSLFVAVATASVARNASAHIELLSPKPRYDDLKEGPCGRGALDARTTNVATFKAGQKITVTWKETVPHPGHYRISFDPNGTSAFEDPRSFTDVSGGPAVLADGITDKTGTQTYSQEVTLPDVACDTCTLQVVQVMTDKPPYGDGNDLYYQCADIVLTKDGAAADSGPAPAPAGTPSSTAPADSGGCAANGAPSASAHGGALSCLAAAGAIVARRARRRTGLRAR